MRQIGVVTTSRADYSSLLPILRLISDDPDLELLLFVGGMHLVPEFGYTVKEIEADGFPITERIEMMLASDTRESVAKSMGLGVIGFANSLSRYHPDILIMVGDRFELLAAVSAALSLGIPIAHVSGGDITEGAIDNQVRYAITAMSHIHFVAMLAHAQRLLQMGEEPWRVIVTGDPALDLIHQMKFLSRAELSKHLGLELTSPVLLVTFHPITIGSNNVLEEVDSLLTALGQGQGTLIFTYPNVDAQNRIIIERIKEFVASQPRAKVFTNLGQLTYYSLLAQADLMVGNSSSGIWEAPSFHLPVLNIGGRQQGRLKAANVIDVSGGADAIYGAVRRGLDPSFRASLSNVQNPYGDGQAAARIVDTLKHVQLGPRLLQKRFIDFPVEVQKDGGSG